MPNALSLWLKFASRQELTRQSLSRQGTEQTNNDGPPMMPYVTRSTSTLGDKELTAMNTAAVMAPAIVNDRHPYLFASPATIGPETIETNLVQVSTEENAHIRTASFFLNNAEREKERETMIRKSKSVGTSSARFHDLRKKRLTLLFTRA